MPVVSQVLMWLLGFCGEYIKVFIKRYMTGLVFRMLCLKWFPQTIPALLRWLVKSYISVLAGWCGSSFLSAAAHLEKPSSRRKTSLPTKMVEVPGFPSRSGKRRCLLPKQRKIQWQFISNEDMMGKSVTSGQRGHAGADGNWAEQWEWAGGSSGNGWMPWPIHRAAGKVRQNVSWALH